MKHGFLTPEFLSIEASGYRLTVLHQLAYASSLDLVPDIHADSEMWNLRNSSGQTPREVPGSVTERKAYVSGIRAEPATKMQKEKLRHFGCAFDENISKGQANDALDKCAREFPEVNQACYNRPAIEERLAKLREINEHPGCGPDEPFYDFENEGPLTCGKAKDLIQEWVWLQRTGENEKYEAYQKSDDPRMDEAGMRIDEFREIARERVANAWAVVKSRMADKLKPPVVTEIEDTLEELFPDFGPKQRDRITYQCEA